MNTETHVNNWIERKDHQTDKISSNYIYNSNIYNRITCLCMKIEDFNFLFTI